MTKKRKTDWRVFIPQNRTFVLGEHYMVYGRYCRFIKVTAKGFNFLDENKNRCIFKQHIYDKRFRNKELPKNLTEVKAVVNEWAGIFHVKKQVIA